MSNRLIHETSPYLLQHAHNPVDWYPWGEEAKARAQAENKPILLSIGYSACHWCHVMERESFEEQATAEIMNRDFVCVKVDREERPDLDEIYMSAVQAFTGGHGGWPMTVFLLPDGRPFLGGTYFPPEPMRGMPSFKQVMSRATELYTTQRELLDKVGNDLVVAVSQASRLPAPVGELSLDWLEPIAEAADQSFDSRWGGFGGAPKFPPHGTLAALLAHWRKTKNFRSLEMVTRTLDAMAQGGMYDLAGGGFARYSVDEKWLIPHFEKMLYDNALLVPVYLDAFAATGIEHYAHIAAETLDYVAREMLHEQGGFYAATDADSEGVEGKFFVFTPAELKEILGADAARATKLLDVTDKGNFEHGTSVLRLTIPRAALRGDDKEFLRGVLPKLYAARQKRVPPGLDDKIITAWNGLMISAFARGGAVLDEPRYLEIAGRAAEFLLGQVTVGGRLMRTWKQGQARLLGYLDDHVFLANGLLDLFDATQDARWLERTIELIDRAVTVFWDENEGGFFYSGHDAEPLIARTKSSLGGALPSGNGVAALVLARLAHVTDRATYRERAERILRSMQPMVERAPRALGIEAIARELLSGDTQEIGIVAPPGDSTARLFVREVHRRYLPFRTMVSIASGQSVELFPWMEGRDAASGQSTAYLCRQRSCRAPMTDVEGWRRELDALEFAEPSPVDVGRSRSQAPALPRDFAAWIGVDAPVILDQLEGRIVVLDFWTYCCINCMHVLPELEALERELVDEPVTVIGVHSAKFPAEKERENVERAVARHRIAHPVVLDSEHEVWKAYGVDAWPTIVVLDAAGRIAWKKSGEVEREELTRVVKRMLEEGRRAGSVAPARARSTATPPVSKAVGGALSFPGKVHVWPPEAAHETARDAAYPDNAHVYVADSGHHRVLELALSRTADGWPSLALIRTFGTGEAGLWDGPPGSARFRGPQGLFRDGNTLWVADTENHALRKIDLTSGEVSTAAGNGSRGRGGVRVDPKRPRELALRSPWDVAVVQNVVLIAMAGTHQIWVYMPEKDQIGPFIGSGREDHTDGAFAESALAQPSGLSIYGHLLFFADSETSSIRLADLSRNHVATVVGRGLFDFGDIDGNSDVVRLQHPLGLAVANGLVYVADTFNHKIKVIDIRADDTDTLAGDGNPETLAEPGGLALAGGFVLIADTGNHRIRAMDRQSGELRDVPIAG